MRDAKENIVFVHYFDEVNKEATGRQMPSDVSKGIKRSLPVAKATMSPSWQPSPPKPLSSDETVDSFMKSM